MEASPDFCASAHKLPETALDIFNQCKGFNFFVWLFLDVTVRDNKLFPFVPGGGIEGGGGDGDPDKLLLLLLLAEIEFDKPAASLLECNGGGGAEGTEGEFLVLGPRYMAGAGGGIGGDIFDGFVGPTACTEFGGGGGTGGPPPIDLSLGGTGGGGCAGLVTELSLKGGVKGGGGTTPEAEYPFKGEVGQGSGGGVGTRGLSLTDELSFGGTGGGGGGGGGGQGAGLLPEVSVKGRVKGGGAPTPQAEFSFKGEMGGGGGAGGVGPHVEAELSLIEGIRYRLGGGGGLGGAVFRVMSSVSEEEI